MSTGLLPDPGAALDTIVAALAADLGADIQVRRAAGAFDAAEIRRHVADAPAVLVACVGLTDYARRGSGGWTVRADLAAYIVTRDTPVASRDASALALVSDTLRLVSRATWGDPERFSLPDEGSLEAFNLYGGDLDKVATALWVLTWRQALYLN